MEFIRSQSQTAGITVLRFPHHANTRNAPRPALNNGQVPGSGVAAVPTMSSVSKFDTHRLCLKGPSSPVIVRAIPSAGKSVPGRWDGQTPCRYGATMWDGARRKLIGKNLRETYAFQY